MYLIPDRELKVLDGIREGKSERRIALDMGCSIHNVKQAKQAMFSRFGVNNQTALLSVAFDRELIKPRFVIETLPKL